MRREVLDEVGLFDETIRRGEDWELNLRIRQAGHRVWFDPTLAVTYWPARAGGAWRASSGPPAPGAASSSAATAGATASGSSHHPPSC
nr:hypothetical protein [Microbacterium sp. NIBRBAC000506063]